MIRSDLVWRIWHQGPTPAPPRSRGNRPCNFRRDYRHTGARGSRRATRIRSVLCQRSMKLALARNPRTGVLVAVPKRRSPHFRVGKGDEGAVHSPNRLVNAEDEHGTTKKPRRVVPRFLYNAEAQTFPQPPNARGNCLPNYEEPGPLSAVHRLNANRQKAATLSGHRNRGHSRSPVRCL